MDDNLRLRREWLIQALDAHDENELSSALTFHDEEELQEIVATLSSNQWMFPCVCRLGFVGIVLNILELGVVDINAKHERKTGLQHASLEGHADVVQLLLCKSGAKLKENLWEEDSEFYLASRFGHKDVVDVLYGYQPSLVADPNIRYCLMYAACQGGHQDLVNKWKIPGINVNRQIELVSDLSNCEHKYPLYAACQGGHLEVARDLVLDDGASITKDICKNFPELTTQLIRSICNIDSRKIKLVFDLKKLNIEYILPCWFLRDVSYREGQREGNDNTGQQRFCHQATNMRTLCFLVADKKLKFVDQCNSGDDGEEDTVDININLSGNRLRELPDEVLYGLLELTVLDVSKNPLRIINDTDDPISLFSNQLTSLNLSHCQLESVSGNIFLLPCLEKLDLSHNKLTTLGSANGASTTSFKWNCERLCRLDVSHNSLTSLPQGIQVCSNMDSLLASFNQLTETPSPWQCPLKVLELSNNKLTVFSPSADQFWDRTLKRIRLQCNELDTLAESIVKMRQLTYLDVSENKIQSLPPPKNWKCPLVFLNMNNNQLGSTKHSIRLQRTLTVSSRSQHLVFPGSYLKDTIMELYLAQNDIKEIPQGICEMTNLSVLDINDNTRITSLPEELGMLWKLLILRMKGITLEDKKLQALVAASRDDEKGDVAANDIITHLERKRRKCAPPDIVKMVVFGCKNTNDCCIVQKLVKSCESPCASVSENLTVTSWKQSFRMASRTKKELTFTIWEFPALKITSALQSCFLTLNSLYLILHDVTTMGSNLKQVSETISSIQACVLRPHIIVVCMFSKEMDSARRESLKGEIEAKAEVAFPKATLTKAVYGHHKNFEFLRQEICTAWENMNDAVYEKEQRMHERQVPSKFLEVISHLKGFSSDTCRMTTFLEAIKCVKKDLDDGIDKNLKLHEFLLQVGAMLHYKVHLEELSDWVVLNPVWLFNVLATFLKSLTKSERKEPQPSIQSVQRTVENMMPEDPNFFRAFLKLLEVFNIAVRIGGAGPPESRLLVPSLLSKQPPQIHLHESENGCQAARLYRLPAIPQFLWSHVICQLSAAFDRFSKPKWKLEQKSSNASIDKTRSFRMSCKPSQRGLRISQQNIQYWRKGIMVTHGQGSVVVEEVECTQDNGDSSLGILITVQTQEDVYNGDEESHHSENLKRLSVIGVVRDELEEILELFNPKFHDPFEIQLKPYALCPVCYKVKPGQGTVDISKLHFAVRDCAQRLFWDERIKCQNGGIQLEQLVPEFLFLELPPEQRLTADDIKMSKQQLGRGMAGSVTKGKYKGIDVAIKVFHKPNNVRPESQGDGLYPNIAKVMSSTNNVNRMELDQSDTEKAKISNAFSEARREVAIVSKLSHKCIVTFIGVCVRPELLLVMELAPHGSLRSELDKRSPEQHRQEVMEGTISNMIFDKDLTYKIVLQIGCGLEYLHKNNIIYRDLKPDNILLMSLEKDDAVNVKLSDYGISKFGTLQGLSGVFGTVGYMAPEVMSRQVYTEKIDIYSYGIVMLEILTGIPPLERNQKPMISQMAVDADAPAHIQGCKIHCNFPSLEILMAECWRLWMDDRPSAKEVVKRLRDDHFALLHDCIWLEEGGPELEVTCIYACETVGRWTIWISESGAGSNRYFSVYDVESSSFTVHRKLCLGPRVISMAKAGSKIWLACRNVEFLQIVVRGHQNKFEIQQGEMLDSKPTKLISHVFGISKGSETSEGFLFAGLENGCVTALYFKHAHKTSVKVVTSIELHSGHPVANMCTVSSTMVAVACGMNIYFLTMATDDIQNGAKSSSDTSFTPELINGGSVSVKGLVNSYMPVESMVAEGNAVWCSLEQSSYMMKINCDTKTIDLVLTLSWDSTCDTVRLEEREPGSEGWQAKSDSGPGIRPFRFDTARQQRDLTDSSRLSDNVFLDAPQPLPLKSATLPKAGNSAAIPNVEVNDQNTGDEDSDGDPRTLYYEIEPPGLMTDSTSSSVGAAGDSKAPPLPPRRNRGDVSQINKSFSMPRSTEQSPPPPLPWRITHNETDLTVTSLALSTDVLIIGTSCGGVIFLPLKHHSPPNKSRDIDNLPCQCSVLRHPSVRKDPQSRQRSRSNQSIGHLSVFSEMSETIPRTGTISSLIFADEKLISLHRKSSPVLRRPQGNMGQSGQDCRRQGSAFPAVPAELLDSGTFSDELTMSMPAMHLSCNDDHNENNAEAPRNMLRPTSGISQVTTLSKMEEVQSVMADIVVWDKISYKRLITIQDYGNCLIH